MNATTELSRLLGLTSDDSVSFGDEKFLDGGFLSYRRTATIKRSQDAQLIEVFIKISDKTRTELEEGQEMSVEFCKNECIFYGVMAPILDRTLSRCHLNPPYPKSFGERITKSGTILVLEDLKKQGFDMSGGKLISLEQAQCLTKSMAKLQAAYWISRMNLGETADSILFNRESSFFDFPRRAGMDFSPMMEKGFRTAHDNLSAHLKSKEDEALIGKGMGILKKIMLLDMEGKLPKDTSLPLGIVQGDFWTSNLMFRGSGDSMECRVVDWQLWNIGTFGEDLGQLMLICLSNEVLQEEMENLTSLHYRVFKETFEANSGIDVPFSEEDAHRCLANGFIAGFVWVIVTSSILWELNFIDVGNALLNVAFALRTRMFDAFKAVLPASE